MGQWRSRLFSNYGGEEAVSPRGGGEAEYRGFWSRLWHRRDNHADDRDSCCYEPSRRKSYDDRRSNGGGGADGGDGILVYDNLVTGDPSNVVFGRGNRAGGKVRGHVSGNRVIR